MTSKMKVRDEHAFRPDDEVLANIERSGRLMEEPPGIDMALIVKSSVDAYWTAWDKRALETPEIEPAFHWRAVRQLSTWGDFWTDWGAVTATVAVLAIGAMAWYGVRTTSSALSLFATSELFWPSLAAVVVISALCAWLYWNGNARNFVGALAGGAFAAVFIGGFAHSIGSIDAMKDLAKAQLEQATLDLMANRQKTGQFDQLSVTGGTFTFYTGHVSKERAVYYATAEGVPGRVVADVGPSSGTVTWSDSKRSDVASLFSGTVVNASADALVIEDASGKTVQLKRGGSPFPSLKAGNFVMGAYDMKTREASVVVARPRPE